MPADLRVMRAPGDLAPLVRSLLDSAGPLPELVCVLPSPYVAHQVRAELGRSAGLLPFSTARLAAAVLGHAGLAAEPGAERHLATCVEAVLVRGKLPSRLQYFDLDQMRTGPGYAQALASVLVEFQDARCPLDGFNAPARQAARQDPTLPARVGDLATLAGAVQGARRESLLRTSAEVLEQAATLLQEKPGAWPFRGSTLVWLDERITAAEVAFLAHVPRLVVAWMPAYPTRPEADERLLSMLKPLGITKLPRPERTRCDSPSELQRLQADLFHAEARADDPGSAEADGSVHLEWHSGVEEELQAAVDWVADQVLEKQRPLERIALLLPTADPIASVLVERLAALPWSGATPIFVAGGLPVALGSAGVQVLAALDALAESLTRSAITRLLPHLRLADADGASESRLTPSHAVELVDDLATLGGLPGRPEGGREWTTAVQRRCAELAATIQRRKDEPEADPEESAWAVDLPGLERRLARLRSLQPAIDRLVRAHESVVGDRPLPALWLDLRALLSTDLRLPPDGAEVLAALDGTVADIVAAGAIESLRGLAALDTLRRVVRGLRRPHGRFGEPRIYVGSLHSAVGLSFDAVRVLGLAEGACPAAVPVDPILPDLERRRLEEAGATPLPSREAHALRSLRDIHRVIRGIAQEVVLSAPRQTYDGTVRECSLLFLEAATVLRRAVDGRREAVPSLAELRRAYFGPARRAAAKASPLSAYARALAVAGRAGPGPVAVPAAWFLDEEGAWNVERMRAHVLHEAGDELGAADGILPADWPMPLIPGLTPDRPTSASRIRIALVCPRWSLYEHVLKWQKPAASRSATEIDTLTYGTLVHRMMQAFFTEHGTAFTARERDLAHWLKAVESNVELEFEAFLADYPLLGETLKTQQRRRAQGDVHALLAAEWRDETRTVFLKAELPFGYPAPLKLALEGAPPLHVRGRIDRVDRAGKTLLIRDIKTGNPHPRIGDETDAEPSRDVQLGVYAMAVYAVRGLHGWPAVGGVTYVYPGAGHDTRRAFLNDFAEFMQRAESWVGLAARMLGERAFPHTPNSEDCEYCPFRPVCGDLAPVTAARKLGHATGALADFRTLKTPPSPEPEADDPPAKNPEKKKPVPRKRKSS